MKFETAVGTLAMALIGLVLLLVAAEAIGPREARARQAPARAAPAQPAADKPAVALPTRAPLQVTPPSGDLSDPASRDARRLSDLQAIADALNAYRGKKGAYPNTGDRVQTACVYRELDKLCEIAPDVGGIEKLADPRGNSFGYWYASDGATFTLFASLEDTPAGSDACPQLLSFIKLPNIFCLSSHGN